MKSIHLTHYSDHKILNKRETTKQNLYFELVLNRSESTVGKLQMSNIVTRNYLTRLNDYPYEKFVLLCN